MSYDEDYNDPAQRCQHGTFIGSWWGPDYLCHYCELGYTTEEYEAEMKYRAVQRYKDALDRVFPACFRFSTPQTHLFNGAIPFTAHFADYLVRQYLAHSDVIDTCVAALAELGEEVTT